MATPSERRALLRNAINVASRSEGLTLSTQAIDAIIKRAEGHIQQRVLLESSRDTDVNEAVNNAGRLVRNLRNYKSAGTFTSVDFAEFVAKSTNCFYPFCKPNK
jgi:hypothetical protein